MTGLPANLPPASGVPPLRQWPIAAGYGLRALIELVRARIIFASITVPAIMARNQAAGSGSLPGGDEAVVAWISYAVPRVARRMPFRSDCLVQALAAQTWLAAHDLASTIVIGAERPGDKPFAAHAWLTCGSRVITGGETAQYTVLL